MVRQSFESSLAGGLIGEGRIAGWLRGKGCSVIPVYEKEIDSGKGPRIFAPQKELIGPDMLRYSAGKKPAFIEAKTKTRFCWRRKGSTANHWETGIDARHYGDYLQVNQIFLDWDLWILFLHTSDVPSDDDLAHGCPSKCPTGLFGGLISDLDSSKRFTDSNQATYSSGGMYYWTCESLKKIAEIGEL